MAQHKPGFFTASTISSLMKGKGNNLLSGGETFAKKIALERLNIINEDADFKGNMCTDWGNMHEAEAIYVYEIRNFVTVTDTQKCIESGWLSCTPDGYIGEDELVEIKCPFVPLNHLDNLTGNGLNKYYDQVQFQLMLSKRKVCNLVSYDTRFKEPYNLHTVKIIPDLEWQERCMNRIEQAESIIKDILEAFVTTDNVFIDLGFKGEEAGYLKDMSNILTEVLRFSKKYNFEEDEKLELKNILLKFLNNRERKK